MTDQLMPDDGLGEVTISDVRFEHVRDALGIGVPAPRISWIVTTTEQGWLQAAYELEIFGADGKLRFQSGRVESDQSVLVAWPAAPLASRERAAVRVRVWGVAGATSPWSRRYELEAGLLESVDWQARFIAAAWDEDDTKPQPGPLFRHAFAVRPGVASARLYVTALGLYEVRINGEVAGDQVLAPGWTSYNHRLRYQTIDVTDLLRSGDNAIGAMLGDGWYRGRMGFNGGQRNTYGKRLALLAQLEITYADGSIQRVVTDADWRAAEGPIVSSDIYDGEIYDARRERTGWDAPGYDDREWSGVRVLDHDPKILIGPSGPPMRRIEEVAPVAIATSPSGRTVLDFGQNLVGWLRLKVDGPEGRVITLRPAEVLQNGDVYTRPLRFARATDQYVLRGTGTEIWEPRFTYHGFRYVDVEGWPGELTADSVRAVICHSDLERTGWFDCSDPLVNRLHENIVWSMRGNFMDIPTDCPQRDERLGWTGDLQIFAPTACFLFDTSGFLSSWLGDVAAEQDDLGSVPMVVPNVLVGPVLPVAAWGDAAVIVPWLLYQRYGDPGILATQFDSMRRWVDCLDRVAGESHLWTLGFQFGDWLDPTAPPDQPAATRTDPALIATAYFARSAELVGAAAGVLGRAEDERRYSRLAEQVRKAFNDQYVSPAGELVSDSATAYSLALQFGMLGDPCQRLQAGKRLATLIRRSRYRISTGFVGTPLICDALCSVGGQRLAFRLLLQRECPSWLYPVTMGATTVWERWDSMLPDGTVNPGDMTSFNHYAFGAIGDWLHRTVAGLSAAAPGYRKIEINPLPGGGLTHARARHFTPYGMAESGWKIDGDTITVQVVVPPNTSATVLLPWAKDKPIDVGSGTFTWSGPYTTTSRPLPTMDSTVEDVVDHEVWQEIIKAVPSLAGVELELQGWGGMTVREMLWFRRLYDTPAWSAVEKALASPAR